MLATAIIFFREVLEAALVVSIVMAAAKGVHGRGRYVSAGIALGVLGSIVVAAFAGTIASAMAGRGQEFFNAGILLIAVAMLAWHNIWMSQHGKELAAQMKAAGHDVASGRKPLYMLLVVVMMAVLREGSEVALFTYGIFASGAQATPMAIGGVGGLALGVLVGCLLYFGLLRIPLSQLFRVTGWMIMLLAAGLSAQAAGLLSQAGVLPSLGGTLWDTAWLLDQRSIIGRVLHVLIGYTQRPSGIQLLFYALTIVGIYSGSRWVNRARPVARGGATA
ncbi:FTR1 family iron permease [Salinisphaera sp.]|uniref:FTR1 family iron permease n=1 Tax=Salinisphaera sp. TaxID=1914330 RepID=UPI002D7834F5|nr:FTR1 family protein [Salinisphaera sp.]HET7315093.1 FTR1 family protein [Salinisphaera sp.]